MKFSSINPSLGSSYKMTNENVRFLSSKYRSLVKRRKHRDVRDADRTFSICIININSNDYMLTNLIIKNAHSNIKKAIKIFESDYKNMKDKKRIKLRGSIFKVDIKNREIKLFYNNLEIIKVLEKNRFIIKQFLSKIN